MCSLSNGFCRRLFHSLSLYRSAALPLSLSRFPSLSLFLVGPFFPIIFSMPIHINIMKNEAKNPSHAVFNIASLCVPINQQPRIEDEAKSSSSSHHELKFMAIWHKVSAYPPFLCDFLKNLPNIPKYTKTLYGPKSHHLD